MREIVTQANNTRRSNDLASRELDRKSSSRIRHVQNSMGMVGGHGDGDGRALEAGGRGTHHDWVVLSE